MRRPAASADQPTQALVRWDEEMAKMASAAAEAEAAAGGGQFFSVKSGVLSFGGSPVVNNTMPVIVLDAIFERVYYEGAYDPQVVQPPTCFALSRSDKDLKPHPAVFAHGTQQHDVCKGCQWDEWASANVGRGKACRETRRLALLPAGTFDARDVLQPIEDPKHFADASVGYLKPPVTSVNGYALYVKQVAATLKRPLLGVYTRIRVVPDAKTQFRITFESLALVPDAVIPTLMQRLTAEKDLIMFPYNLDQPEGAGDVNPARGGRGPAAKRTPAKRKF